MAYTVWLRESRRNTVETLLREDEEAGGPLGAGAKRDHAMTAGALTKFLCTYSEMPWGVTAGRRTRVVQEAGIEETPAWRRRVAEDRVRARTGRDHSEERGNE